MRTLNHRLANLEGMLTKRQQAAAPDLASLRRFFANLHRAYGEPGEPPPELSDAELLEFDAQLWQELDQTAQ